MKILLLVETPDDDRLHWPLIEQALLFYVACVRYNNTAGMNDTRTNAFGMDGGPNAIQLLDVKLLERRVDLSFLIDRLRTAPRRWLRSRKAALHSWWAKCAWNADRLEDPFQ